LDKAPGHPQPLQEIFEETKVMFQCTVQAVISTFKWHCLRRTIKNAMWANNKKDGPSLKEFWKGYNVCNEVSSNK
jgi:hypothetical protein